MSESITQDLRNYVAAVWSFAEGDGGIQGGSPADLARRALEHIEYLERWQAEATAVLAEWDRVHEALGSPGQLGRSMAVASRREVLRLRGMTDGDDGGGLLTGGIV
jgi:hypothetical protein